MSAWIKGSYYLLSPGPQNQGFTRVRSPQRSYAERTLAGHPKGESAQTDSDLQPHTFDSYFQGSSREWKIFADHHRKQRIQDALSSFAYGKFLHQQGPAEIPEFCDWPALDSFVRTQMKAEAIFWAHQSSTWERTQTTEREPRRICFGKSPAFIKR